MIPLSVAEIADLVAGDISGNAASDSAALGNTAPGLRDVTVTGPLVIDSRQVTPGAIETLPNRLRSGDVVLVKASKAAGLWEVADGLLAEVDQ